MTARADPTSICSLTASPPTLKLPAIPLKRPTRTPENLQMSHARFRFLSRVAICAVAFLTVVVGIGPVPADAASGGSISGRVTDPQGTPLEGICVSVDNGPGTQTSDMGTYSIEGIDPGSVRVQFFDCRPSPRFVAQWYLGHSDPGSADSVVVIDGSDTPLADVVLAAGIAVNGTVTDSLGVAIPGIAVAVNSVDSGGSSAWTQTDADGAYTTTPLPPGGYKVQFSDASPSAAWARQYWNGQPSWNTARVLTLTVDDAPARTGVDATLTSAATISGTVTGPDAAPLPGICVDANVVQPSGNTDWVQGSTTAADGTYVLAQLPATDVRVHFRPCNGGPYVEEWYADSLDPSTATPVSLTAGESRTGIDAQLAAGITVSGHVSDPDGNPIAGVGVSVNPDGPGSGAWGQTDANGDYNTGALRPGTYRVQFQGDGSGTWATEYWNHQVSWNRADLLMLASSDTPTRSGVDATLTKAATITGTVTKSTGGAAAGVCVSATVDGPQGLDWVGGATSAPDGSYTISSLPATPVKVMFDDCNGVGPYVRQWYSNAPDPSTAQVLDLSAGVTRAGVDAHLAPASEITGTVTDGDGHPVAGICVQATTATAVGALARSNDDGRYTVLLSSPGAYKVQFVDCSEAPRFASQWWHGAQRAQEATSVTVGAGSIVTGIDAQLRAGAPGSISGHVLNVNGAAVTGGCVVLYLPNQYALFAPVEADGSYSITGAPSGTYTLAFLGCPTGEGDPSPVVPDPQVAGVAYPAVWWDDVPLSLTAGQSDGGPDPIAQGAKLVTIPPGVHLTGYDHCFGCTAVRIEHLESGPGYLTASFTTPGVITGASPAERAQAAPSLTYQLSCRSSAGFASAVSGSASPLTIALAPGEYTCRVSAFEGAATVARSADSATVTVGGAPVSTPPSSPPDSPPSVAPDVPDVLDVPVAPGATNTAGEVSAVPREELVALAFTGRGALGASLVAALGCLLVGAGFLIASRRRRA